MTANTAYESVEAARAAAAKALRQERKRNSKRSKIGTNFPAATQADVEIARELLVRLAANLDG
ncbi:MAG: hypothetical protein WBR13_12125 [Allosphingosinicella sp.]